MLSLAPIIQVTFCIYRQLTFPDAAFAVDSETDDIGNEFAEVYVYLDKAENAKRAREGGRLPLLEDGFWESLGSEMKAIVLGLRFAGGANAVVGLLVKHLLKCKSFLIASHQRPGRRGKRFELILLTMRSALQRHQEGRFYRQEFSTQGLQNI